MSARRLFLFALLFTPAAFAADSPIDRWAAAVGGREKVAAVKAVYREATIDVAGYQGWIKAWHTPEGRYRKEEQVGPYSTIETFDGTTAIVQQGTSAPHPMTGPELARAISSAFANWNSVFFVFFPDRRHGSLAVEDDGTIIIKPEGGIDWRVTLDPETSLPKTMVHQQGEHTITVQFVSYETIDGLQFEKEIHRSTGDPRYDSAIRFTKTVINPPIEASLFTIPARTQAPRE
jgi:hypothetical protein